MAETRCMTKANALVAGGVKLIGGSAIYAKYPHKKHYPQILSYL